MPVLILLYVLLAHISARVGEIIGSICLITGLLLWCNGTAPTVGASGLIFGLFSYVSLRAFGNPCFWRDLHRCSRRNQFRELVENVLTKMCIIFMVFVGYYCYSGIARNGLPNEVIGASHVSEYVNLLLSPALPVVEKTASGAIIGKWSHYYGLVAGLVVFTCEFLKDLFDWYLARKRWLRKIRRR